MAGMKTVFVVLLGVCLLVGVVHGYSVDRPDNAWQFSVDGNTVDDQQQGGRLIPNGYQYRFEQINSGATGSQFSDNSFADLPEQFDASSGGSRFADLPEQFDASSGGSSFSDQGYVYDARSQDNTAPYDYTNNQFSTLQYEPESTSYALGVPEQRDSNPEYVYNAFAGDGSSFSTRDTQGSPDDQAVAASDVRPGSGDEGASFSTVDTQPGNDQVVPAAGHQGPVSYFTPASNSEPFHYNDARNETEKKKTSAMDVDPASGAESFSQHQDTSSDTTTASTSPILATTRAPEDTHGCPNSYWVTHVKQWPKEVNSTTTVCQAFGGVNLRKNLEIIYGTTTVLMALMDTRPDPYSKLLTNAVAALLNAYAKPAFPLKPAEVSKLFHAALASKTAVAAQAQKFENENHAFGASECK